MKKWLLVLGMITCMLGLTACGQKEEETPLMSEAEAEEFGAQIVETINQYVVLEAKDQVADPLLLTAIESWESAAGDMGDYEEIIGTESKLGSDDGVVDVRIKGSVRDAIVEIVIERGLLTSISVNVEYTFGEKMEKAALNTVLGMGTVFVVLVLISFIISLFVFIPKIQDKFTKKPEKQEVTRTIVEKPIVQAEAEEDLTDDLELVAVIAAAIAASEGASSTEGFVVRSIRRTGRKWQRA